MSYARTPSAWCDELIANLVKDHSRVTSQTIPHGKTSRSLLQEVLVGSQHEPPAVAQ